LAQEAAERGGKVKSFISFFTKCNHLTARPELPSKIDSDFYPVSDGRKKTGAASVLGGVPPRSILLQRLGTRWNDGATRPCHPAWKKWPGSFRSSKFWGSSAKAGWGRSIKRGSRRWIGWWR